MVNWGNFSSLTVTNCILWDDTGGEIHNSSATPDVTYCDIEGGYDGTGNIGEDPGDDPLFVSGDDYHLQAGSPCIDAGSNTAPSLPDTDFEGDSRIIDGNGDGVARVDMGVDEYLSPPPPSVNFVYSVKFLWGSGAEEFGVEPANYATAINIHNFLEESFIVEKKAVIAVHQGADGVVSQYEEFTMGPNYAVEIDGADICDLLDMSFPPPQFITGFVEIRSPKPLNIVAVYTARSSWWCWSGMSIDIEQISPVMSP